MRASGVMVEDTLNLNRVVSSMVYSSMDPARYADTGSIDCANWKWVPGYRSVDLSETAQLTVSDNETLFDGINDLQAIVEPSRMDTHGVASRQALASAKHGYNTEIQVQVPLSYLHALFRGSGGKMFPLSFCGQLTLEYTLADRDWET